MSKAYFEMQIFAMSIDQWIAQHSLWNFILDVNVNRHRDPQLVNVWRIRDFGVLNAKWDFFFIKPFPLRLRLYVQNETERFLESEVVDDFKYTDF